MTEIEKLYENAEVNKECEKNYAYLECPHKTRQCEDCVLFIYPAFTAEKQISLIKLLAYKEDTGLLINIQAKDDVDIDDPEYFEECLAQLINKLWQNLKDYEKDRIREILNG